MAFIQVTGVFDDPALVKRTQRELVQANLASPGAMRVEPEELVQELHPPRVLNWVERLKDLLPLETDESRRDYAEGVRRGSQLLIVTVPEERADRVRDLMRRNGAVDMQRRVHQWNATGRLGFEPPPSLPEMIVEEPQAQPRMCIDESNPEGDVERTPRNIRLFDEATGREIGRISEEELKTLQNALEEEDPDDNDYWINEDEIDELACRPGATPHLIKLLRDAVRGKPEGIDIAFQRADETRQSFREKHMPSSRRQS